MKTIALFIIGILFLNTSPSQKRTFHENGKTKYEVTLKDGMLDGKYISYYNNGIKRAEGDYKKNQRVGLWRVWNKSGKIRAQRFFTNNYYCKILLSEDEKGNARKLHTELRPVLKNEKDLYPYRNILEKDVFLSQRTWRKIDRNKDNKGFLKSFEANKLLHQFLEHNIQAYEDDDLVKVMDYSEKLSQLTQDGKFHGFKFIEDYFYNSDIHISETRIIAICPLFMNESKEIIELAWFYYPDLRKVLSQNKVNKNSDKSIAHLEDLFHFDCFNSQIYKSENVYDREIKDFKDGEKIIEEAWRIEMNIIDMEHAIWISLTESDTFNYKKFDDYRNN